MNEKIEYLKKEYNSIVEKFHKIKKEHRYEKSHFEVAQSNMYKYLDSLKQLILEINSIREEIVQRENKIFIELKQKYPNVEDEDIYSSMEYQDAKQWTDEDRNLCDRLETQIQEYMHKFEEEIEKIKQDEIEFKEKQEKLINDIRQKILGSNVEYGDELGIIQSIVKLNDRIVENIYEAGTKAEFELSKELKVPYNFCEDDKLCSITQKGLTYEGGNSFKIAEKCTLLREKDALAKRKKVMEQLKQLLEENPETCNREGKIIVKGLAIPMTQKELIEVGLVPESFGWKPLEQIKEELVMQNDPEVENEPNEENNSDDTTKEKQQQSIMPESANNAKKPSFQMIEYKESALSKFKNFLRRIFR